MTFLPHITPSGLHERLIILQQERADIETLGYMLGPDRMLEWAHSVGVATDNALRQFVPPVPPIELRSIVAAPSEPVFLWTGLVDATSFMNLHSPLAQNQGKHVRVLDFGCGCGRMTRFLGDHRELEVFGTDVNGTLVSWCQDNLTAVRTSQNGVLPPLDYSDGSFDLVYSLSIFTHLPEKAAFAWLDEIARVLAPGGIAILTTHGNPALDIIAGSEQHKMMFRLDSEQIMAIKRDLPRDGFRYRPFEQDIVTAASAGDDYGNSFTDETYIRSKWSQSGLQVVNFLPGGLRGWQDVTVLRK